MYRYIHTYIYTYAFEHICIELYIDTLYTDLQQRFVVGRVRRKSDAETSIGRSQQAAVWEGAAAEFAAVGGRE